MSMRPAKPRGFAMLVALTMLALVAAVLVILARYFAYETFRTRAVGDDAQLSQLLHAAADDVLARSKTWGDVKPAEKWDLRVPGILVERGAGVSVEVRPLEGQNVQVTIDAQLDTLRAAQTLRFSRTGTGWGLSSVELPDAGD